MVAGPWLSRNVTETSVGGWKDIWTEVNFITAFPDASEDKTIDIHIFNSTDVSGKSYYVRSKLIKHD